MKNDLISSLLIPRKGHSPERDALRAALVEHVLNKVNDSSKNLTVSKTLNEAHGFLDDKKIEFSRILVGVIDGTNLIDSVVDGLSSYMTLLDQLLEIVEQACDSTLTHGRRQEICRLSQKITATMGEVAEITRYGDLKVLKDDIEHAAVPISIDSGESIEIQIQPISPELLNLHKIDLSNSKCSKEAFVVVKEAFATVQDRISYYIETSSTFLEIGGLLEKEIKKIITVQEIIALTWALDTVERLEPSELMQSHNTSPDMMGHLGSYLFH